MLLHQCCCFHPHLVFLIYQRLQCIAKCYYVDSVVPHANSLRLYSFYKIRACLVQASLHRNFRRRHVLAFYNHYSWVDGDSIYRLQNDKGSNHLPRVQFLMSDNHIF